MNVQCYTHERGSDLPYYALFENAMPHDLALAEREIRRAWSEADGDPRRLEIAEKFFHDRAGGKTHSWYPLTASQRLGLLPSGWSPEKKNIAIFNSSDDEFAAIGDDYINPVYASQQDALERLIGSLSSGAHDIHVYLRIHPNLKGIDNYQTRRLATLKADFLTIIPADDPVSTYTLLKEADKVLTFGSTVGIEAAYWGTPSILAGQTVYRNLGGTYNPRNHEEVMALLRDNLPPKDRTPALMFGYYFSTYGIPFKYYRPLSMTKGEFKGHQLTAKPTKWPSLEQATPRALRPVRFARNALFTLRSRLRVTGSLFLR
jgi:hypothetical protein